MNSKLTFVSSMCSVGSVMSPELVEELIKNGIRKLEVLPQGWEWLGTSNPTYGNEPAYREPLARGDVEAFSIHLPFGNEWDMSAADEAERAEHSKANAMILERFAYMGYKFATLHAGIEPITDEERPHRLAQAKKSLRELLAVAKPLGVRISVEWLPRTCIGNTMSDLLTIVDGLDPNDVGILIDVNHVMNHAAELPDYIRALTPRLFGFHISDYNNIDECHWIPTAGAGSINWPAVMAAIREAAPKSPLGSLYMIWECGSRDKTPRTPAEHAQLIAQSFDFIKNC